MPDVDHREVEFNDQQALVGEHSFTGIVSKTDATGRIRSRSRYRGGLPEGLSEIWYAGRQLKSRWIALWSNGPSESWDWQSNRQLALHQRFVDRHAVETKASDDYGSPIKDETQPPLAFEREGQA